MKASELKEIGFLICLICLYLIINPWENGELEVLLDLAGGYGFPAGVIVVIRGFFKDDGAS